MIPKSSQPLTLISQGAQLAHNALNELGGGGGFFGGSGGSATISNRIAAVVGFFYMIGAEPSTNDT